MARLENSPKLSIVIPSLNEATHLPLLIADLNLWPDQLEICVCDACSSDESVLAAELSGAKVVRLSEPNRGAQLHYGASNTDGDWLLFLHADCRMLREWPEVLTKIINQLESRNIAWFFDFKVQGKRLEMKLLEIAVAIRSNLFKRPYGDQGLLIHRSLYEEIGGYKHIYLMEDLDIVERLSKKVKIKSLCLPLYSDGRRWKNINYISKALKNAKLRRRWRRGESSKQIFEKYYEKQVKG